MVIVAIDAIVNIRHLIWVSNEASEPQECSSRSRRGVGGDKVKISWIFYGAYRDDLVTK